MLLTLTTTRSPATDLGFLLHKHPDKLQTFSLPFGHAHVFYPEAGSARCTAALLLGVDPVGLTRRAQRSDFALYPYVNDRPYVASSFLSVALARVFGSALNGLCPTRPELLEELPLSATLTALPCRGGPELLERLFGPLGYALEVTPTPLDPAFPEWGDAELYTVTLSGTLPLAHLLRHLYVLVPVLDDDKHYWVGDEEVAKLLDKGAGWLETHPERDDIARRYLKHQRSLAQAASEQFGGAEARVEQHETPKPRLHDERLGAVFAALKASGAASVLDLGCGEGRLTEKLLAEPQFIRVVGTDVSPRALERARRRLRIGERPEGDTRLTLLHSSLLLRDARLAGFDVAALVEVLEHLEPTRLAMFERILFGYMKPKTIVLSTPNREYNAVWPGLKNNLRHPYHRFEWTRTEFGTWTERVSAEYGYGVTLSGVGPEVAPYGQPSQMAVFRAT